MNELRMGKRREGGREVSECVSERGKREGERGKKGRVRKRGREN